MADSSNTYQGRLALVTGGSSGLGLALAQQLAQAGANVWLMARRAERLDLARKTLFSVNGQKHGMYAVDVTKREQVQSAIGRFQQEVGIPDLLFNCAGAAHPGYVQEIPLDVFDEMMNLNYFGTVNVVKAVLPRMLERGSGHIVNISSAAAYLGVFGYSAYGASKYAVRGFSDVLRAEAKPLGVSVSVVFPPDMDTPGLVNENKTKPFETHEIEGNAGVFSAEKVAKDILDSVRHGRYVIVPGLQNKIFYRLSSLVGNGVYPIMDMMVADARKKKQKANGQED